MRKVLLATTALVALNVSAASADISISGSYNYEFMNTASDTTTSQDGNINIKGTGSTDTGLSYTVYQSVGIHNTTVEHSYLDIAGDFGSVRMGYGDTVFDRMDGVLGMNQDIEGEGIIDTVDTAGTLDSDASQVSYMAPSISGLQVGVHADIDNDKFGVAATYSLGGVKAYYGKLDDETSYGIGTNLGGIGINIGGYRDSGSTKRSANDIALSYSIDNMKLVAVRQSGTSGSTKATTESLGAKYTVGGLWLGLEAGDDNGAAYSWVGVGASF
jgi:hypothetical protein